MRQITKSGLTALAFFIGTVIMRYILEYINWDEYLSHIQGYVPFIRIYKVSYIAIPSISLFISLLVFKKETLAKKLFTKIYFTILFLLLWLSISVVLGGILWAYHDMGTTHYLGGYSNFFLKALSNIRDAAICGPFVLIFSIPYNIICLIYVYFLIKLFYKKINC